MRGQAEDAVRLARELVPARPTMALGHSLLAQSLLQAGKTQEALDVMLNARKPGSVSGRAAAAARPHPLRGGAGRRRRWTSSGRWRLPGDPQSLNAYALALSEAGRQKEAFETSAAGPERRARRSQGLGAARPGRAAPEPLGAGPGPLAPALELNRKLPLAWNNLGVALFQLGEKGEALDAWQKAVDLQPDLWDALWNLGTQAAEQGRMDQARKALERFAAGAPPARYGPDIEKARAFLQTGEEMKTNPDSVGGRCRPRRLLRLPAVVAGLRTCPRARP